VVINILAKINFSTGLVICCGIGIVICLCLLFTNILANDDDHYSFTFDGKLTYSSNMANLEIVNERGNSPKPILLYGIDNNIETIISATKLVSGSENKAIDLNKIKLDGLPSPLRFLPGTSYPLQFKYSIDEISSGSYHGWLIVANSGSDDYIPISISTPPKIYSSILIVVIGIFSALGLREYLKILSISINKKAETKLMGKFDALSSGNRPLNTLDADELLSDERELGYVQRKLSAQKRRTDSVENKINLAIINVGTIFVGTVVSSIALMNDTFVLGITEIDVNNGTILWGLGFGIGSLIEFAEKKS
jgi:hypothetical protein